MCANNTTDSPLRNPVVRHGIGLFGAAMITAVAFLYLDGTLRAVALGVAVLDAVVTPKILERAIEE